MRPGLSRLPVVAALLLLPALELRAESRLEKVLKLSPGGHFRLDTDLGSVTVTGKATPDVRLDITSRRQLEDLLTLRFDEAAGSVTVTARRKRLFSGWFGDSGRLHYEIEVPAETALDIDTSGGGISVAALRSGAKLDTSGGGITVRDLVGALEADTSGGSIQLADVQGRMRVQTSGGGIHGSNLDGDLSAETSGGSIELERVTGDIHASSSGGGIHIREAGGFVDAETSGGGIEASFTKGNARGGRLETSGGGIEVAIDPEVGFEVDAQGSYVKTEVPVRVVGETSRHTLRGSLGKGGAPLYLRTSGGGVRIRAL
ncbi:MAG: DUF4097 family beta strand repeat-containing protein [Thermoanaerobaculia bacterium]